MNLMTMLQAIVPRFACLLWRVPCPPSYFDRRLHIGDDVWSKPLIRWPFWQILNVVIHYHVSEEHFQLVVDEESSGATKSQLSLGRDQGR